MMMEIGDVRPITLPWWWQIYHYHHFHCCHFHFHYLFKSTTDSNKKKKVFAENRCGKRFVFWRPGKKFFRFPHISSLSRRKRRRGCKLVDEGCKHPDSKIGTKAANVPIQKSGRREQLVPIQKFGRRVQTSRFKIGTKGAKKKFFFFPKASTGSVSLIIAPKVSQDCLNDQADTADHSL